MRTPTAFFAVLCSLLLATTTLAQPSPDDDAAPRRERDRKSVV